MSKWTRITAILLAVVLIAVTLLPVGLSPISDGILSISLRQASANPDWLSGWDQRVKLTTDNTDITSALSNFPTLLYISTSSGRNNDDISFVFDELTTDANCKKIAVTTSDGETQCYVEIEEWDDASEEAWLWVKAASISSSTDTDFYLYYDSDHADNTDYVGCHGSSVSQNVWDSNFKLVQHLSANWPEYGSNPIISPEGTEDEIFITSVFKDGSTYYMFYPYKDASDHKQIGLATSTDGKSWTKDSVNNPILVKGSATEWDDEGIYAAVVWKEGTGSGCWKMLYTGHSGTDTQIGLATADSPEGIWTRSGSNPVIAGTGYGISASETTGVIKVGSTYYCWVSGYTVDRTARLYTSSNLTSWTADGNNPIFAAPRFMANPIKYGSNYYLMVVHYTSGVDYAEFELYKDTNPTFYSNDRTFLGTVKTTGTSGTWDDFDEDVPYPLTDDIERDSYTASNNELWIYYTGESGDGVWEGGLLIAPSIELALQGWGRDSTSNGNNITSSGAGGPIHISSGQVDGCANFTANGHKITIAHSASLNLDGYTDSYTVEVWAKATNPQGWRIVEKYDSITEARYPISIQGTSTTCSLVVYDGTNIPYVSLGDIWDGTWQHIVMVVDNSGDEIRGYLQGAEAGNSPVTNTVTATTTNPDVLLVGNAYGDGARFPGPIDEVRISNSVRSAAWIKASYESGIDGLLDWGSEEGINPEITNTPSSKDFGILEVNTTSNTAINYFTIENTGNCNVDVTIQGTDATGGDDTWTLSDTATPGENIYGLYAGLDDVDDLFDVIVKKTATYNTLLTNLAESATQDWGLKIYMPTSVTDYDAQQMSGTVTLVASEAF